MRRMPPFGMLVLLAAAPLARADVTVLTAANLNAAIVDDGYNGTLGSMTCANIPVSGLGTVSAVKVLADVDHTWIGDLVFKVVSPSATVVTLMSRPGVVEAADDGTAIGGDSSNLSSAFRITFADGAATSAESMGNTITSSGVVCRDDATCAFDPNAGAAVPGKLVAFVGQPSSGTWKLCVGDGGAGDIGVIMRAGLVFTTGQLQITPISADFGPIAVGMTSAETFITLANTGAVSLTINSITAAAPPFARTASGTCGNTSPFAIAASSSCTLSYTFTPIAGGPAMQSFAVQSDGGGDTGFTLNGSGTLPDAIFQDGFE